ncbi:hypothetical protein AFLA_000341 [Aspergillus flavus NRRL3357]|nr:hypothetical protein AFLA_000341 [Aspergillus flavus NRRL3357]
MPRWTKRQERDYDAYNNRDIENGEHSKATTKINPARHEQLVVPAAKWNRSAEAHYRARQGFLDKYHPPNPYHSERSLQTHIDRIDEVSSTWRKAREAWSTHALYGPHAAFQQEWM